MTKRIDPQDIDSFPVSVSGIPAIAKVEEYRPGDPGRLTGPPERCYPPEPEEVEYTLHDRKGYPAPWLEQMADERDVERQILDQIHERQREAACEI